MKAIVSRALLTFAAFIVATALLTQGCSQNSQNHNYNDIKYDSIVIDKSYYLLGDTANPKCHIQSSFIYPSEYEDNDILQKILSIFTVSFLGDESSTLTPEEAMDRYVNNYFENYKMFESEYAGRIKKGDSSPLGYNFYEMSHNEILYNKNDFICFSNYIEFFTGGAHPGHSWIYNVIDLKTGGKVSESDIFIENFQEELAKIIIDKIASDKNILPSEMETRYYNVEEIYPNNNFYVNDDGITYIYNEYEIAAYAVGATIVTIPYEMIGNLIKKDSPIHRIIQDGR